jgi:hypothetical protein
MSFFKPTLPENQPVTVTIVERFAKTEGQYGAKFPYKIQMNGTVYDHDATLTEEKALQKIEVGQQAEVTKKPNSYGTLSLFWNPVGSAPPRTAPVAKPSAPLPAKPETDWDAIADSKIIHNFMIEAMKLGKSPTEGEALAVQWHLKQLSASQTATKNRKTFELGIPSVEEMQPDIPDMPF